MDQMIVGLSKARIEDEDEETARRFNFPDSAFQTNQPLRLMFKIMRYFTPPPILLTMLTHDSVSN
jgi:hypothetical protein